MKYQKTLLPFAAILLAACSSKPYEPLPIVEFDNEKSIAMNIANQTDLTKDYERGMETYKSPLRDLSIKEIEDNKANFKDAVSASSAMKAVGVFRLLTGDIGGLGSVGMGYINDMSRSKHYAKSPRWIAVESVSKYPNSLDATIAIQEKITQAIIETFGEYGVEIEQIEKSNGYTDHVALYNGIRFQAGFGGNKAMLTNESFYSDTLRIQATSLNKEDVSGLSYTLGLNNTTKGFIVLGVSKHIFYEGSDLGIDDFTYDIYMEKLTRKLGGNYYYYEPNYTAYRDINGKKYTITNDHTPKIYTNGKRYDFVEVVK
ncbi:hypothetical protein [Psychromonas sp. KJ10-2]|uniref:hypothetical protein n=1 Tax=Psychromonas sp. KJ10-2 TaxID=3391822 RepID=UPI0039B383A4